jgi:hypothetical protein
MKSLFELVMFKDETWIQIVEQNANYTEKFGSRLGNIINNVSRLFNKGRTEIKTDTIEKLKR